MMLNNFSTNYDNESCKEIRKITSARLQTFVLLLVEKTINLQFSNREHTCVESHENKKKVFAYSYASKYKQNDYYLIAEYSENCHLNEFMI